MLQSERLSVFNVRWFLIRLATVRRGNLMLRYLQSRHCGVSFFFFFFFKQSSHSVQVSDVFGVMEPAPSSKRLGDERNF